MTACILSFCDSTQRLVFFAKGICFEKNENVVKSKSDRVINGGTLTIIYFFSNYFYQIWSQKYHELKMLFNRELQTSAEWNPYKKKVLLNIK